MAPPNYTDAWKADADFEDKKFKTDNNLVIKQPKGTDPNFNNTITFKNPAEFVTKFEVKPTALSFIPAKTTLKETVTPSGNGVKFLLEGVFDKVLDQALKVTTKVDLDTAAKVQFYSGKFEYNHDLITVDGEVTTGSVKGGAGLAAVVSGVFNGPAIQDTQVQISGQACIPLDSKAGDAIKGEVGVQIPLNSLNLSAKFTPTSGTFTADRNADEWKSFVEISAKKAQDILGLSGKAGVGLPVSDGVRAAFTLDTKGALNAYLQTKLSDKIVSRIVYKNTWGNSTPTLGFAAEIEV
jgi:hypothetical protein